MKRESPLSARRPGSLSRRNFLAQTGSLAAGATLAGATIRTVHAAEDNTIRLDLIGCGGRGRGAVADAFSVATSPIKLHAMADLTDHARVKSAHGVLQKEFADRVDVPADRRFAGFDAYRHAIDCLRPGDVAMLTAYSYCRPVQIEYAVEKGVNVFMEKSFASDPAGCRRILAAGEAAKKRKLQERGRTSVPP